MPGIVHLWNEAARGIANGNDGAVHTRVLAQRDKGLDFPQGFAEQGLANHQGVLVERLTDCVTYLIWEKLANHYDGDRPDRLLGISDLRAFLGQRYNTRQVDEFVVSLGGQDHLGDVRAWLTARERAKRQLYKPDVLDLHLLESDIEELRRAPPRAVRQSIKEQYLDHRDRVRALRQWRKQQPEELRRYLPRQMPRLIQQWAFIIARQLATGTCNCPRNFSATDNRAIAAETRCRHSHFLSEANLAAAMAGKLPQQKRPLADPFEYVERAVVERRHLRIKKSFAATMLANEFTTPGEGTIRQLDWKGRDVLTETSRHIKVDVKTLGSVLIREVGRHTCLGCANCLCFLGDKMSVSKHANHLVLVGSVGIDAPGEQYDVAIKVCQAKHVWVGDAARCPICEHAACYPKVKLKVIVPDGQTFSDIVWSYGTKTIG